MTSTPLDFLKLLAHNLRWEIVQALAVSDHRVNELVERVGQPMNLVSYHLRQLREAGIVTSRRSHADGRDVYYHLDLARMQEHFWAAGQAIHPALVGDPTPQNGPTRRVLFLCTHNSARSQIAEGLLRAHGNGRFEVYSAGSHPTVVSKEAVRVMTAHGIDISAQTANHVNEYLGQRFDYVITVCDQVREVCPTFDAGTTQYHWGYPDPNAVIDADERRQAFEQVAAQLAARIRYFINGTR